MRSIAGTAAEGAVESIAAKIGCAAQTLHDWTKKAEVDAGKRVGVPTEVAEKLKALERENRELRQANEILRKASAYFAQAELDPLRWAFHPAGAGRNLGQLRPFKR